MTPPVLWSISGEPLPNPTPPYDPVYGAAEVCDENLRLRQEYIDSLADFNSAASLHGILTRAGAGDAMFDASWRKVQIGCASSRRAWARYRQHVSAHGCKRA